MLLSTYSFSAKAIEHLVQSQTLPTLAHAPFRGFPGSLPNSFVGGKAGSLSFNY